MVMLTAVGLLVDRDAAAESRLEQAATQGYEACGGLAGEQCAEGYFCEYKVGECLIPDIQGICRPVPEICTRERDPVCGCDVKTYSNACEAHRAGVSILAPGECPKPKQ